MRGIRKAAVLWLLLPCLCCCAIPAQALEAEALVPVGSTVGIALETGGVTVAGLTEVQTESGAVRPAEAAGLKSGDIITGIGDRATPGAAEFLTAIGGLDGAPVDLKALRDGHEMLFRVTPAKNIDGGYQMGLWLRDGVSGIGTVTFYDPVSGTFGALGHGICDPDSGKPMQFCKGEVTASSIVDVIPGAVGTPGELCGRFDAAVGLGTLEKNTEAGIFGCGDFSAYGTAIPVADEAETKLGPATILANVEGEDVREYAVEISRIYRGGEDNRFLLLTVTDEALIERTGGIVQGMSGSPILQDGKLVGAVTHVLVNDPTRGYGISMEDMLRAA